MKVNLNIQKKTSININIIVTINSIIKIKSNVNMNTTVNINMMNISVSNVGVERCRSIRHSGRTKPFYPRLE